ncbi:MAG: hypothetical protein HKN25_10640 [Pyrinomonadaceae bacterium]|nr:hypothetical protein [Pyrinomonadaceae bacterium]
MKLRTSAILNFLAIFVFLTSEIFACACCAERGHYSINVSKPSEFVFNTISELEFRSANLFTNAGYPDNIRGINPLEEAYSSVEASFDKGSWKFTFKNSSGNAGTLTLARPDSMVSYMVDLEASDEPKPMVSIYKEWRFKYRAINASGIFKNGVDRDTEYFLVLRGKGNLCTNAGDFDSYRLEISGKNAEYSFFGKVTEASTSANSNPANTIQEKNANDKFVLGKLNGDYSGCSCSLQTYLESKRSGKWKTINFYQDLGSGETGAYLNVDGKDEKFKLISKGKRAETEKIGDTHTDVYQHDGITVTVTYTVKKLPCEGCEGTDYDVVLSASRGYYLVKERAYGSCGC